LYFSISLGALGASVDKDLQNQGLENVAVSIDVLQDRS